MGVGDGEKMSFFHAVGGVGEGYAPQKLLVVQDVVLSLRQWVKRGSKSPPVTTYNAVS